MTVIAVDPITGLRIGAPGTAGSGRLAGQKTKRAPSVVSQLGEFVTSGGDPNVFQRQKSDKAGSAWWDLTFPTDIDTSTFMDRPMDRDAPSYRGQPAGESIYDQEGDRQYQAERISKYRPDSFAPQEHPTLSKIPGMTKGWVAAQDGDFDLSRATVLGEVNARGYPVPGAEEIIGVDGSAEEDVDGSAEEVKEVVTAGAGANISAKIDEFTLRGFNGKMLHDWINNMVNQGLTIIDVIEDPSEPGWFFAITDDIDKEQGSPTFGKNIKHRGYAGIDAMTEEKVAITRGRFELEAARLDHDVRTQEEQLRIQEEIARVDQDIARDRIQHEQEIASGNWQNALDVQDRIDERERSGRQLERDLFNANQVNLERRFELERAEFDLDKLEFFQSLSLAPANFADIFNITRGLAPIGAGGPLPQGVQRIAGLSTPQQTAANDFQLSGIDLGINAPSGAFPAVTAEGKVPEFNPDATQLSFLSGGDPTPVDASGEPLPVEGLAPSAVPFVQSRAAQPDLLAEEEKGAEASFFGSGVPSTLAAAGFAPPATPDMNVLADTQMADITGTMQQGGAATQGQGAPLPPGLQMAFANQQLGAPQTPPNSIPLLSPQVLATLSPAEREAYFAMAQMQGQFLPNFEQLLASRGGSQQISDSQRVFA